MADYKEFLNQYVVNRKGGNLLICFLIYLNGVSTAINKIYEKQFHFGKFLTISSWEMAWAVALSIGIIGGIIGYYLGGIIFQLFVRLCGGSKEWKISRRLLLYLQTPISIFMILAALIRTFAFGEVYIAGGNSGGTEMIFFIISYPMIIGLILLAYFSVRYLFQTKPLRSKVVFLIVPLIIFHLAVVAGILLGFYEAGEAQKAINYNDQGVEYYHGEKYNKAEELYKLALEHCPKTEIELRKTFSGNLAMVYNSIGLQYHLDGDYTNSEKYLKLAIEFCRKADDMNPGLVYKNLAHMYEAKGDFDNVIDSWNKALKYFTESDSDYFLVKGNLSIIASDLDSAKYYYEKALELDPSNEMALVTLEELNSYIAKT